MSYKPSHETAIRLAMKTTHLMELQARAGVKFDIEKAKKLLIVIDKKMKEIEELVEPQLPKRQLSKSDIKSPPKLQFKQDGTPSKHCINYFKDVFEKEDGWYFNHPELGETPLPFHLPLETEGVMRLSNQGDIKQWLLDQGWEPSFWNFKKDKRGKAIRGDNGQYIKTSPKIQEQGKICENLLEMEGDLVRPVVKWLSYRNRRSVIKTLDKKKDTGWLNDTRLTKDGRLSASFSGPTGTWRMKHRGVVNVPKAADDVLIGKEMRDLFIVEDGNVMVGYDASGLEARVMAHFTFPYDKGAFGKILMEGDIHSANAKAMFPDQTKAFDINASNFDKEHPLFKPWRSKAKNYLYAAVYGASPGKLAKMVGVPEKQGKKIYDAFWKQNKALAMLREDLLSHYRRNLKATKKKFIINSVSGSRIWTRSEHSCLNFLFQSTGAFVMDMANHLMDKELGQIHYDELHRPYYLYKGHKVIRVLFVHDECQWECEPEIAEEIGKMGVDSIRKSGKILGLNIGLDGDYGIGPSWRYTH